jgi:pre-mRNA-splicing factor ATP-dependent RNA helicase DHX15/PRP43
MYEDERQTNGVDLSQSWQDGASQSPLASFKRHKTTAAMAREAEDSKFNPLNGKPLSEKYFSILKTRRDLPVHSQR